MSNTKIIKSALISVYYKDNLEPIIKKLHALNVKLYSTGGTLSFIEKLNIPVTAVDSVTSYPEIFGGRVKTLHPAIFGGILNRRDNESDKKEKAQHNIPDIDLVIVDLYPFEETVAAKAAEQDTIEKIDIGGISLIRAAAKNFNDVVIVSSRNDYSELLNLLETKNGASDIVDRKHFAAKAFATSSHYDTAIFNYFNQTENITQFKQSIQKGQTLRYGENPHQKGVFYGDLEAMFTKLHGKELSYNNLLDVDAAVNLIADFTEPTFAILKHNNACGVASRSTIHQAYVDALAGDPVSAFGGILIANKTIDLATATEVNKLFCEVVIAPAYHDEALALLKSKVNRIILIQNKVELGKTSFRNLLNGVIEQDKDLVTETETDLKPATTKTPTASEIKDLLFANKLVKHTKSNTIVFAKNGQLLASGTGQTSRVDALKQAIVKAQSFGFDLNGAVMASDAFFPFPDCVEIAHKVGITAVIQPGGSIKDKESIEYCNANGVSMVMTGVRHFKH
ncbi:bifunctional phosphoribosylaminoimidazolecarboxamide formyltransferase/IMP cyclohydrolase [Sediminibacterium sp.]|uniref:bifunctional phosphoribosylaminoimidazolecarboxamide formyltransferase/IMP cyclohydrolase n=1 Tax=Sediminibacterium sp. TaxID=1917865 RepID=UPI002733A94C|nr:bifunctional phosphoribosylaminoimidazolecarboxamide formyltransferase/IMP cyclohydrolase [Sediminibacterium sp.]MDP3567531.1 bifunctional phosphoribosylaminoimidazolecarboxamide formyltransferase/IMP cyclohydrolase [Sediminibacterium sp.]